MARVIGWAIASHCRQLSKSAWPPSASASLVSRLAIGAVAAMPGRGRQHLVEEAVALDHPRDQAQPERLVGVHDPAREQQVAGVGLADDLGQQVGARHPGVHAELHERRAELGPGAAYRMSQASARHRPAPMLAPLTAAIVGTSSFRIESQAR